MSWCVFKFGTYMFWWMEDLWLICMWHCNNWGRGKGWGATGNSGALLEDGGGCWCKHRRVNMSGNWMDKNAEVVGMVPWFKIKWSWPAGHHHSCEHFLEIYLPLSSVRFKFFRSVKGESWRAKLIYDGLNMVWECLSSREPPKSTKEVGFTTHISEAVILSAQLEFLKLIRPDRSEQPSRHGWCWCNHRIGPWLCILSSS